MWIFLQVLFDVHQKLCRHLQTDNFLNNRFDFLLMFEPTLSRIVSLFKSLLSTTDYWDLVSLPWCNKCKFTSLSFTLSSSILFRHLRNLIRCKSTRICKYFDNCQFDYKACTRNINHPLQPATCNRFLTSSWINTLRRSTFLKLPMQWFSISIWGLIIHAIKRMKVNSLLCNIIPVH